jgi:hypothetical protein
MVGSSLVLSLLASAVAVVGAAGTKARSRTLVPGAFIVEFEDTQVSPHRKMARMYGGVRG